MLKIMFWQFFALSALCWSRSPAAALNAWRTKRLGLWTRHLEARWDAEYRYRGKVRPDLRYRTQILVVDSGDGMRARTCEAIVDSLCGSSAADIDCASTVLGPVVAQQERPAAAELWSSLLGLPPSPFEQPPRRLIPSDLLSTSRWDVVLCVDLATLERVRSLARAVNVLRRAGGSVPSGDRWDEDAGLLQWSSHLSGEGEGAAVLCASDFLAGCVPITREGLVPEELQPYLAESTAGSQKLLDLPKCSNDGLASEQLGRAKTLLGAAATCSVGLITYLEAAMLEHARKLYRRDLAASFPRPRDLATSSLVSGGAGGVREDPQGAGASATVPYEEAAQHMQFDHAVPGGLSDDERRRIFDEYMDAKDVGPGRAEGGGIDVSDLGLTMDDLFGPMGGL